jgi:pyridoxamine 5'-phosphate oxidase-like protein
MRPTIDCAAEIAAGGDKPLRRAGAGALQELVVVWVSVLPDSWRERHERHPPAEQGDSEAPASTMVWSSPSGDDGRSRLPSGLRILQAELDGFANVVPRLRRGTGPAASFDRPNFAHLATLMLDGSPQSAPVWVGREGDRFLVCTGEGSLKAARNTRRDPRIALSIVDMRDPYMEVQLRGRVVEAP